MSEEKKVNETEEKKVNKAEEKHGVELTDEELAQVTGGVGNYGEEHNPEDFEHYDDGGYYYG